MKALRIALAFLRIPRLSLLILGLPVLIGVAITTSQLLVTGVVLESARRGLDTSEVGTAQKKGNLVREFLFQTSEPFPEPHICRWQVIERDGNTFEVPPTSDCRPDRLDVAIRTPVDGDIDLQPYLQFLRGSVERIHICQRCSPDLIIDLRNGMPQTNVHSVWAGLMLVLFLNNDTVLEQYASARASLGKVRDELGKVFFFANGFEYPLLLSHSVAIMAVILNIVGIVVISVWMALKAHRSVLLYISRGGALLPMVAAFGRGSFYRAIWIITAARVAIFLACILPIVYGTFSEIFDLDLRAFSFFAHRGLFPMWLLSIILSMALAALTSSVAELKERQHAAHMLFRYLPIVASLGGGLLWCLTFVIDGPVSSVMRDLLSGIPIIGIVPIIVAPLLGMRLDILLVHSLLSLLSIIWLGQRNARWFAAHVEEV